MRPSPTIFLVPMALLSAVLLLSSLPIKMILGGKAALTAAIIGAVLGIIVAVTYLVMKYKDEH